MKGKRIRSIALLLVLPAMLVMAAVNVASASEARPAHAVVATVTTAASPIMGKTTSTNADQCGVELSKRVGGWICGDPTAYNVTGGWCRSDGKGCWDVNSTKIQSLYLGNHVYGYNHTTLGKITLRHRTTLRGRCSDTDQVAIRSTRGTRYLGGDGERWYLSSTYPGGHPVYPDGENKEWSWDHTLNANTTLYGFASTGGKYTACTSVGLATETIYWDFHDVSSAYPGDWWILAKSNVIHRTKDADGHYQYHFGADNNLPAYSMQWGWRNSW